MAEILNYRIYRFVSCTITMWICRFTTSERWCIGPVTVKAIWVQWSHCPGQEAVLRSSELCDIILLEAVITHWTHLLTRDCFTRWFKYLLFWKSEPLPKLNFIMCLDSPSKVSTCRDYGNILCTCVFPIVSGASLNISIQENMTWGSFINNEFLI